MTVAVGVPKIAGQDRKSGQLSQGGYPSSAYRLICIDPSWWLTCFIFMGSIEKLGIDELYLTPLEKYGLTVLSNGWLINKAYSA